jgi:lambda repressor-like predicted transcriptional regulator
MQIKNKGIEMASNSHQQQLSRVNLNFASDLKEDRDNAV